MERRLSQHPVAALHQSDVAPVRHRHLVSLPIDGRIKLDVRVVEHPENLRRILGRLHGPGQNLLDGRVKGVLPSLTYLLQQAFVAQKLRRLADKFFHRPVRNLQNLRHDKCGEPRGLAAERVRPVGVLLVFLIPRILVQRLLRVHVERLDILGYPVVKCQTVAERLPVFLYFPLETSVCLQSVLRPLKKLLPDLVGGHHGPQIPGVLQADFVTFFKALSHILPPKSVPRQTAQPPRS